MKLICFPFAGGNKYSYRDFQAKAPASLELIPFDYPGRGARMRDPLLTSINAIVDDLYEPVCKAIAGSDYAIYGHSMGGLVAYAFTQKMLASQQRLPLHLFITGTSSPSARSLDPKKRHLMPKKEFIEEIILLNGMPEEILKNAEMMEYFEPILRSDFSATETYQHSPDYPLLDIPITVITGTEEDFEEGAVERWQEMTSVPVEFHTRPGKHFFIYDYPDDILSIIAKNITPKNKFQ